MKKPSSLALALLAGFLPQIFDAAEAQQYSNSKGGYRIDPSRLQKAEWNRSPLEVHILDMSPRVKDFRGGQQEDSYTINIGPTAQNPGNNYVINAPGAGGGGNGMQNGGGRAFGGPRSFTISGLPQSGFEANAPLAKPIGAMRNLANGHTTNLLANTNAGVCGQIMTKPATRSGVDGSSGRPNTMPPARTMSYSTGDYRNPGASAQKPGNTHATVVGVLKSRLK
ncbi:MAG: hypothetical protein K2W95_02210 [Candidatus Obscuribacterales bacterium]|nr:hypothetical protein [Candidatus Obscuribacterales bacterium]